MEVTVKNVPLRGRVAAPPSKSDAHRALICAALAGAPTQILMQGGNEDIEATVRCLTALGARIAENTRGIRVAPVSGMAETPLLDCGESGSTLRFLLPVAAAVAEKSRFTGSGRLPGRPIGGLLEALSANGCVPSAPALPLTLSGKLKAGKFDIPGNVSSQFVSGLLMALPLLDGDSRIELKSPLESSAYVDMTINTLKRFGVGVFPGAGRYTAPGRQRFCSPSAYRVEGDWSGASFFLVAGAIGGKVDVGGLNESSAQPDRAILNFLDELPDKIDVSAFPDLFPVLAVRACAKRGDTILCGAARLRIKESDRVKTTCRLIRDLGGAAEEFEDSLLIHGTGRLRGGTAHSENDHRIAMTAGIAAGICEGPVTITGAEAVNKSYPAFWEELKKLGV